MDKSKVGWLTCKLAFVCEHCILCKAIRKGKKLPGSSLHKKLSRFCPFCRAYAKKTGQERSGK